MFAYFPEFTCRISDILKVVPRPEGGTFIYIVNPDKTSCSGTHRESTAKTYEEVVAQLAASMQQQHAAYINSVV